MKKLSVIIPVYNEVATIEQAIEAVKAVGIDKEIIVVDDCSSDGTRELLRSRSDIKLIESVRNRGKGAAIRAAIPEVTGDIVVIQDADLEYDPQDIPALIQPILEDKADIVYGSRFARSKPKMRLPNYIANRVFAWVASFLYRTQISDEATCYKAFRTEVLKSVELKCKRFEFCPEVTAKLLKRRYRYMEVPISYNARTHSQGKKITWKDGLECLWTLIKYRFKD